MPQSEQPTIVFAPGAGAGISSAWMQGWRDRLAAMGDVEPFDYPYRLAGRKTPDKLPVLITAHIQALAQARAKHHDRKAVVLAGKSMGGRVGCHVALEEHVDALICFGYPLRGTSGALRDEVLVALRTPILFIQGTRDPLCPLRDLEAVLPRMSAPHDLLVVEGGNHSLEVARGKGGRGGRGASHEPISESAVTPQSEVEARIAAKVQAFLAAALAGRVGGKAGAK